MQPTTAHPNPPTTTHFLKRQHDRPAPTRKPEHRVHAADDDGPTLVCAACGHPITTAAARTEKSGRHAHTFANPHGFVFHIGCFARAPGCEAVGERSTDFSWFPGFAWQVAVCRGCGEHLGWAFHGPDRRFHGLIVDRLAETGESGPGH